MTNPLKITTRPLRPKVSLVSIAGEVDDGNFTQLGDCFLPLLEGGAESLVVDVSGLTTIGLPGIGEIVGALMQTRPNGGDVVLVNPRPEIREAFDSPPFDGMFTWAPDPTQALELLS